MGGNRQTFCEIEQSAYESADALRWLKEFCENNEHLIIIVTKINYGIAINACIRFFYSTHADFSALEKLIARNKCLSDPLVFLKDKLVIILPSVSITDYHNSFLLLLTFSLLIQKP